MKKIIKGKLYNTETAERVGYWSNSCSYSDFSYCEEGLYRKRTGEFFLYGYGGPMSKYAESCGNNSWTGGSQIVPLTYEAAQKWAEEHLDGDEYEAIFGEIPEDDSKSILPLYLPASKVELYKREASKAGKSMTSYLEGLIDAALSAKAVT